MSTKIRIDLSQGIVEAEGSESFVRMIYDDFKERIDNSKKIQSKIAQPQATKQSTKLPPKKKKEIPQKRKATPKNSNPKMVNDLDLSGRDCGTSLKDFYNQYKVKSNLEKNLMFLYYLKNIMNEEKIGINHIFTCYRNIDGVKIPGNLEQSIRDTRTSKSWIDYKRINELSITVHGINFIEHDIKKK